MALNKEPRGQLDHTWRFDGLREALAPVHEGRRRDAEGTSAACDCDVSERAAPTAAACFMPTPSENPYMVAAVAAQALLEAKTAERDGLLERVRCCDADIERLARFVELARAIALTVPQAAEPRFSDAHIAAALASLGGKAPLRKIIAALHARGIAVTASGLRKRLAKGAQFVPQGKSWRLTDS